MSLIPVLKGLATCIPGLCRLRAKGTGGTNSARYCYSVWLRHLTIAHGNGLPAHPQVVAELGPGDSLGIGLAALLTGATDYWALDIVKHANLEWNMEVFDELVALLRNRERIPDQVEFPRVKPLLSTYDFPYHVLSDEHLDKALNKDRIESIRDTLLNPKGGDSRDVRITYCVPWYDAHIIGKSSVDMVYSQAVLEHVDDLALTYRALYDWLKVGGFMSHVIDFTCHHRAKQWNGHWAYSDTLWRIIRGKRAYLLNREPCTTHISLLREASFKIICELRTKMESGIRRKDLARRFESISDEDLTTSSVLIQAVKKT